MLCYDMTQHWLIKCFATGEINLSKLDRASIGETRNFFQYSASVMIKQRERIEDGLPALSGGTHSFSLCCAVVLTLRLGYGAKTQFESHATSFSRILFCSVLGPSRANVPSRHWRRAGV
jgi:hypothetical protein